MVAIAEPRPKTQKSFAELHGVDKTLVFNTWQGLLAASAETISTVGKRLADAVLIAVQDYLHAEVAVAFAAQGYHILCEKPMATDIQDCIKMENAIKNKGIVFGMGHGMYIQRFSLHGTLSSLLCLVMRYSPYSREITEIVRSGSLGELINITQIEPVGFYHFAHSYVRGNWSNEKSSSFALMTKCCQYVLCSYIYFRFHFFTLLLQRH